MSIRKDLIEMLKSAVKTNDVSHKNVIRCLKAKAEEYLCSKNMPRDLDDDDVYIKVIQVYSKSLSNAIAVMEKNDKAKSLELVESYRFEVEFCKNLLPKGKTEEEILPIVEAKIKELGITDQKQIGKIVGAVMKDGHKGVAADVVKKLALLLIGKKD